MRSPSNMTYAYISKKFIFNNIFSFLAVFQAFFLTIFISSDLIVILRIKTLEKGGIMNKQDLIAKVAEVTGMQKSDSEKAVNAVFDQITDTLKARGEVRLVGFGTFKTSIRKASQGRNPRTNEVIQIPQSTRPKFTPGKGLKEAVNNAGGGGMEM